MLTPLNVGLLEDEEAMESCCQPLQGPGHHRTAPSGRAGTAFDLAASSSKVWSKHQRHPLVFQREVPGTLDLGTAAFGESWV